MIKRELQNRISGNIDFNKAIIILGSRQVGKTTFVNKILDTMKGDTLYIPGTLDYGRFL